MYTDAFGSQECWMRSSEIVGICYCWLGVLACSAYLWTSETTWPPVGHSAHVWPRTPVKWFSCLHSCVQCDSPGSGSAVAAVGLSSQGDELSVKSEEHLVESHLLQICPMRFNFPGCLMSSGDLFMFIYFTDLMSCVSFRHYFTAHQKVEIICGS